MPPLYIDLRPLMADPAAAVILMLARGQLNRACRKHGLSPSDSLQLDETPDIDLAILDDPAAAGIDQALAQFDEAILGWSSRMPLVLARPILDILRRTYRAVADKHVDSVIADAVWTAHEFLLRGCEQKENLARGA
jgi:hypothetical protein